ncbi:MAG: non-homologous end-joining DNA ligase [Thermoplasmata archaeon]|nr:non-homologous end-joining DNA ligase [Thermoplasmata archaeon]
MKYLPMLAVRGDESVLDSDKHIFEPKMDGTRCVAEIGEDIKLFNRRQKNITKRYPEIVDDLKNFDKVILDGEIICYNNGMPDFYRLQQREHVESELIIEMRAKLMPATYVVFDILEWNGKEMIKKPLMERKEVLEEIWINGKHLESIFYTENGSELWKNVKKLELEGVMAKEKDSHYYPGERRKEWIKIKNIKSIDVVIVGYTSIKREISSLGMGLYDENGDLLYIGKVGTGFDEKTMELIKNKLKEVEKPTVKNYENAPNNMRWVLPEIVAEIEYLEKTGRNEVRSPSFKRLRDDKEARECPISQLK